MEAFTTLTGIAAPIDIPNVDTNQICPTEFNKVPVGDPFYPKILFHYLRFNADGTEIPEFILNKEPFRNAKIIVADRNWGGGSSRKVGRLCHHELRRARGDRIKLRRYSL